jgi:uncharacterized protein (TIGR02466 family)
MGHICNKQQIRAINIFQMQKLIFPTRIDIHDLSGEPDWENLKKLIRQHEQQIRPHGLVSDAGSSYGTPLTPILSHFSVRNLRKKIEDLAKQYALDMQMPPVQITNSWFNIMGQGQSVKPHRHEVSVFSGALYVEAPEGSVPLNFHSPLAPCRMAEMLLGSNNLNENFHSVECKEGQLVLFPSWLEHSTNANKSDRRVVVSFNTEYGPPHVVSEVYNRWRLSN